MKWQRFQIAPPERPPPASEGWFSNGMGYFTMTKSVGALRRERSQRLRNSMRKQFGPGVLVYDEFEDQCIFNVLANIKKEHMTLFELGAGRGDVCLRVAAAIDFQLIPTEVKTCRSLALETCPTHCEWIEEHFSAQGIDGVVVCGGAWDENGPLIFKRRGEPKDNYGSGCCKDGPGPWPPAFVRIPGYTVGGLMREFRFSHVDFIHMDVQNAESRVCLGALNVVKRRLIDYIFVETHGATPKRNVQVIGYMEKYYNVLVDIPPCVCTGERCVDTPLGPAHLPPVGGIVLLERKELA